jgi:hypothetical protein
MLISAMQAAGAQGDSKEKVPILSVNVINQQEKTFRILLPALLDQAGYPVEMENYKVSDTAASKVTMLKVVFTKLPLVLTIQGRITDTFVKGK